MNDDDIHAFVPPMGGTLSTSRTHAPPARRRRVWPWLLGVMLMLLALVLAGGVALMGALLEGAAEGVQVVVDGQPWSLDGQGPVAAALAVTAALVGLGIALLIGLLVTAVVVPLVLVLALLAVLACVVFGLAGPLLAMTALAAVLLSPLWLALLLWWLLRRRPSTAQASAATVHA